MLASAADIRRDVSNLFKAPNRMPVAEAVANYMRVPIGGGNSVNWDPSITPYIVEPMNCLNSREYDAVIFVGPARTGKTVGLVDGWVVYNIVCDPSDMLIVQLTEEKAREYSRKRLERTFRVSPEVNERLSLRSNDNNVHDKVFKAGNYLKIGWPSVNIMSSSDYRFVAITDYDRWEDSIGGEGDGFSLGSKRTTTFMSSGMTLAESSPGKDVVDLKWRPTTEHEAPPCTGILSLFNRGDRRKWYWLCPECKDAFRPELDNMTGYEEVEDHVEASESAVMCCPHCHHQITSDKKRDLNNRGFWLKDGQKWNAETQQIEGEGRKSRFATFWMEGPAAGYQTWQQLIYKLLSAEQEYERTGSEETLRTVVNTDWGRPYLPKSASDQRQSDELMARAEYWERKTVPEGVRFLLASVDVQGGKNRRFVCQIQGYGENGERWIVDRFNLRYSKRHDQDGVSMKIDPSAYPEDWRLLVEDVLFKAYPLADSSGRVMQVMALGVDQGGEDGVSDNAYKFWRWCRKNRLQKRVFLFKGDSLKRQKMITKSYPDNTGRSDRHASARGDVPLYLLQTDQLKDRIANALKRETVGPNYVHFPRFIGEWFYDELTYEERGPDGKWRKPGRGANEALDLMCYCDALAILHGYDRMNWDSPKAWADDWNSNPHVHRESDIPEFIEDEPVASSTSQPMKKQQIETRQAPQPSTNDWLSGGGSGGGGGWL
ncbi:MAG: phage terminase large subunit family protein [Vibrio sp.]